MMAQTMRELLFGKTDSEEFSKLLHRVQNYEHLTVSQAHTILDAFAHPELVAVIEQLDLQISERRDTVSYSIEDTPYQSLMYRRGIYNPEMRILFLTAPPFTSFRLIDKFTQLLEDAYPQYAINLPSPWGTISMKRKPASHPRPYSLHTDHYEKY